MNDNIIDARGLSCPEPVLLAMQALKDYAREEFCIIVSAVPARDNVLALLHNRGISPIVEGSPGEWRIRVGQG